MPRNTTLPNIVAAAALMTFQAALLTAIACGQAGAAARRSATPSATARHTPPPAPAPPVYRCRRGPGLSEPVTYQHTPCRTEEGVQVLRLTGLQPPNAAAQPLAQERPTARGKTKKARRATEEGLAPRRQRRTPAVEEARAGQAVPLTRHRPGKRPFEHLGQKVRGPDETGRKRHKRRKAERDFVARVPDRPDGGVSAAP